MNNDYRVFLTDNLDRLEREISECEKSEARDTLKILFSELDVYMHCLVQYDRLLRR